MRHMFLSILTLGIIACTSNNENTGSLAKDNNSQTTTQAAPEKFEPVKVPDGTPVFTLAWSPYTSWSALASADAFGLIDNREGWGGQYEMTYGVDVVLQRMDYVQSFGVYGAGTVDALTITNTDALAIAKERKTNSGDATVAVFVTSWSKGADKILVEDEIATWAGLQGVPVKGAESSVTQYLFWRACTLNGTADQYGKTYLFENLDPVVGAPQFAGRQSPDFQAFGGWSPETFIVLDGRNGNENTGDDVLDLFNSAALGTFEITDMLIVGQNVLDRPGGTSGVKALASAMQAMTARSKDPGQQAETFRAISPNFNDLDNGYIGRAMELTLMTDPLAEWGIMDSPEMRKNMALVTEFSLVHNLIPDAAAVPIGWGTKAEAPDAVLRFDTSLVRP